jgi:hypothetical protein
MGIIRDPFLGLQAADWLAYELYLDADRLVYSEPTERWALRQFQTLPGSVKVYHKDRQSLLRALQPYVIDKTAKMFEAVKDATEKIEKAKGESPGK